jgi:Phytanoyl-CoA dioxygenase (PhyH)
MSDALSRQLPDGGPLAPAFSSVEIKAFERSFADQGYLVFPGVVSRSKLAGLRMRILEEFDALKASGGLFAGGGTLTGHLNCFPGEESRFVYEELRDKGILDVMRALFPGMRRSPNVGCNLNLPSSIAQHYHADRPFTQEFAICNVAIVETDVANGAIEVIPGTHKEFQRYWRFVLERVHRRAIRVALNQGDVLVRSSNLWHRGMPNLTPVARPMLALTWEDGGSVHDDPFAIDGGKIGFRPNWYRPNWLGRMRERTFITAPFTYAAYRFVRSLIGTKGYDH